MKQIRSIAFGLVSTWLGVISSPAAFAEHTAKFRHTGRPTAPACVCPTGASVEEEEFPEKVPSKTPPEKVPSKTPYTPTYKVPLVCFEPSKVLPEECHDVPADVCVSYFKDRVAENKLKPVKDDDSTQMATFCLKLFREQLFKD